MSRRFRPFYVAALAVIMVGLYGTEVIPKTQKVAQNESVSVQPAASAEEDSGWLGPQLTPSSGLLDLTTTLSILPFEVAR
jgi:hypothetical protein